MVIFTWYATEHSNARAELFMKQTDAVEFFLNLRVRETPHEIWVGERGYSLDSWYPDVWLNWTKTNGQGWPGDEGV